LYYKSKRGVFGKPFWAIKDVSLDLYQGETLGIIGRNGVGKSTLLRLMAGILKPDKGEFINYGSYKASLLALQLGFLPYLSGRENAVLSGMLLGLRRQEIQSKMNAIIEFSGLGEFIDRPIATYSSGMMARLGFSVAFQAEPDILLIDEVLGVGDAEFSKKSAKAMQERMKSDKTIVFVSHNAALIRQLCTRAAWIEEGITRISGIPEEVLPLYHRFLETDVHAA
jgi:lipopolysaccharide transport system ATP-binding protein